MNTRPITLPNESKEDTRKVVVDRRSACYPRISMQENQTITVDQLRLSALGLGNLGCDEESPEINQQGIYIGNLYKTAIYAVKETGRLEVADAEGKLLLVFLTDDE